MEIIYTISLDVQGRINDFKKQGCMYEVLSKGLKLQSFLSGKIAYDNYN
jgi:hypothetical protein